MLSTRDQKVLEYSLSAFYAKVTSSSILFFLFFAKRYHDFLEFVTESISTYTKEINGKKVLMWTKDQVEEIVAAMVVHL